MLTTKEAIILAGGKGTRLGALTQNTPKPLLPVGGKPFLHYLIHYLAKQGIKRIVLSTGYKAEAFKKNLPAQMEGVELVFCEESTPLGTGGGLKLASKHIQGESFFALNGDTYFPVSLSELEAAHVQNNASISLALKQLENFDRYGTVTTLDGRINAFIEKKACSKGLINGGVYLVQKSVLKSQPENSFFSFEKDILEKKTSELVLFSKVFSDYFIDLGVPEDFERAQGDCLRW